jgi:site-specific recombinase XerD
MGAVRMIRHGSAVPTLSEAIIAYLATLDHPETAGTRRVYASTLRQLRGHLGGEVPVAALDEPGTARRLAGWFADQWGTRAPATFNRNLDAIRSAVGYWRGQAWLTTDPTRTLRRRGRAPDRTKALSRAEIESLLAREELSLRERVLWRLLYETAARAAEVLALNVKDLDLRNRCAKVRRKGNAADVIVWQTATARLLPRLLRGRTAGRTPAVRLGSRLWSSPAVLPTRRRAVQRDHRWGEPASAAPFRADPCRGGRCQHRHPARLLRSHLGRIARPLRPRLTRSPVALAAAARSCPAALSGSRYFSDWATLTGDRPIPVDRGRTRTDPWRAVETQRPQPPVPPGVRAVESPSSVS